MQMDEFYIDFQLSLFKRLSKCPTFNMATFRTSLNPVEFSQVSFAYFHLQLRFPQRTLTPLQNTAFGEYH